MAQDVINNSLLVTGAIYATGGYTGGTASIRNADIAASAGVSATKLEHQTTHVARLADHGATPAAKRLTLCRIYGTTGTLVSFRVGLVTVLASGTVTVDLYKNGTTMLTGTVTLNSTPGTGGTAYDTVAASLASTALVAGDVLEVVGTVSTPSGGGGWYAQAIIREDAA